MKAEELMLGNWVLQTSNICGLELSEPKNIQVGAKHLMDLVNENTGTYKYSPIPLTPGILEKAGFKEIDDDGLFELNNGSLIIQLQSNYLTNNGFSLIVQKMDCFIDIHYLHQLQNLYYSLTHTPLNVEL